MSKTGPEHVFRYTHEFSETIICAAHGACVRDRDGREILDFTSGQMSAIIGHAHPEIVATVSEAVGRLDHLHSSFLCDVVIDFTDALSGLLPDSLSKVLPSVPCGRVVPIRPVNGSSARSATEDRSAARHRTRMGSDMVTAIRTRRILIGLVAPLRQLPKRLETKGASPRTDEARVASPGRLAPAARVNPGAVSRLVRDERCLVLQALWPTGRTSLPLALRSLPNGDEVGEYLCSSSAEKIAEAMVAGARSPLVR